MKIGDLVRENTTGGRPSFRGGAIGIIVDVQYSRALSWFKIKVMWHDERRPFYYSKHELEAISEDR